MDLTAYETQLHTFTEDTLPDLDQVVLGALAFLSHETVPAIDVHTYKNPLVVGSGNAYVTGKLLFGNTLARVVEESGLETALSMYTPDALYIISAGGSKHAISCARLGVESGVPVFLITTNMHAPATALVGKDNTIVFPHIREPYTYNTSTYMSMLKSMYSLDSEKIITWIKHEIDPVLPDTFEEYTAFTLLVPGYATELRSMFETKFDELFGPYVQGRAYTFEESKHAKTVITAPHQCMISFGEQISYGNPGCRITVPLPPDVSVLELIAIGYYVIGRIQAAHRPYFKEHIDAYTKEAAQIFGEQITPIVE